ncbi:vacuolating cytotoxin domain-containing protein [Helicobacter cynogastricus]|uniref:vacuolating cytotoxin domain-containing protein n=1 Tax=Helicobacter cynogastricus TaxID=329937 RepID=UPI0013156E0F|nr:vacuolating cytotoxin domain-containing protein [Helicobacter cynogastricus]
MLVGRATTKERLKRLGLLTHKKPLKKRAQKNKSLGVGSVFSKGFWVLGVVAVSFNPLRAYYDGWLRDSNLDDQSHIGGYVNRHSVTWRGLAWYHGNDFYHNTQQGYYCANYWCNTDNPVTLHNNNNLKQFYLSRFNWQGGGNFNLDLGNADLNLGYTPGNNGVGGNEFGSYYHNNYFNDTFKAGNITISQDLTTNYNNLNLQATESITTQGYNGSHVTISASNDSQGMNLDAQSESFNNTTFTGNAPFHFKSDNITFENVTFSNSANSTIADNGTLTLKNTITLQQNSPLNNLDSTIKLEGTIFNITKDLSSVGSYQLLSTSKTIDYDSKYLHNLWQLIHYRGQSGTLTGINPTGLGTYHVVFNESGVEYIFGETFSNKDISISITKSMDIWKNVYDMNDSQTWRPNVGTNGIAYIDPAHNHNDPGYNASNNSLSANAHYQWWPSKSFTSSSTIVEGTNATLVIGNNTPTAASMPSTQEEINKRPTIYIDPDEASTYHSNTSLTADNVFMTNNLVIGPASVGAFNLHGTGNIGIKANNTMTMDGLQFTAYYGEVSAGIYSYSTDWFTAQQKLNIQNSHFNTTGGTMYFNSQDTTINNAQFTGNGTNFAFNVHDNNNSYTSNNNTININNTTFNDPWDGSGSAGTISLEGANITLNNTTFEGNNNQVRILGAGSNNNTTAAVQNLTTDNTTFDQSKQINITAQNATFNNTTFDTTGYDSNSSNQFKIINATFNNDTFNGYSQYSFPGLQKTTFEGTTTISTTNQGTPASPFAKLGGQITLGSKALFDVMRLAYKASYTLLSGNTINWNGDTYADAGKSLWNLIQFKGQAGKLLEEQNGSYIVGFDFGGTTVKIAETLNDKTFSLQLLTNIQDIWPDVYCMQRSGIVWDYCYKNPPQHTFDGKDGGIFYIDPNLKYQSEPYNNPNGNFLNTWTGVGNGGTFTVTGTGTLIIGNNATQAATGGTIQFGKIGYLGYITDVFNAYNIFMTNTINVGTSSLSGGGASMTFQASNNLTTDGLTYHDYITAFPGLNKLLIPELIQKSQAYFQAKTLNINNSSFQQNIAGTLSFTGNQSISFEQSTIQGSATQVTIYSPQTSLTNSAFFLGNGSTLDFNQASGGTGYLKDISVQMNDSTLNLNQQSRLWFHGKTTLDNTVSFLNLGSSADFYGPTTLSGTTILNLDHNSTIAFWQGATLSGNANLNLINGAKATFIGNTTFSNDSGITLTKGTSATFNTTSLPTEEEKKIPNVPTPTNPSTTFSDQSFLNVSGDYTPPNPQQQNQQNKTQPNYQAQFQNLNFNQDATLTLNSAAIESKATSFSQNVGVNMANSLLNAGTLSLNGGNFLLQNSKVQATSGVASGSTNLNLQGNSQFTFNNAFNLNGVLKFSGLLGSGNTQPLIKVDDTFSLGAQGGLLNLANIDLSAPLSANNASTIYDILQAKDIEGISGADGYQKIDFYGIKIDDATYSTSSTNGTQTQSWSFTNPLDGAQTITEEIKDGKLTIKISKNSNPVATSYYNIAPELYFYKQSKQNTTGADFNYSDNRAGTFFLDGNLKGAFTPKGTDGKVATPIVPGTYSANGQPLQGLYISNSILGKDTFNNLYNIASSLVPQLENLLKSGILNDLNDPNKALQALLGANISLTPDQKTQLLDLIDGLSSNINQTFSNGTLVVGSPQAGQTGSSSVVWFGGNGYSQPCAIGDSGCQALRSTNIGQLFGSTATAMGYIQTQFNAKDIYITGTVGSGNAWGMGGSADVTFNSSTNLTLNDAKIQAQATDGIFNLLGQGGVEKLLGQKGLPQMLGNYIYSVASGSQIFPDLIPNGITNSLPAPLVKDLGDKLKNLKLSDFLSAQDMGALLQMPGMENVIKDILSTKTVSSVLGSGGLVYSLSQEEQNRIFGEINKMLPLGGSQTVASLANGFFGNDTLLNLIGSLSPISHMNVNGMLNFPNTPQGQAALNNFLKNNTFGQVFEGLLTNSDLLNKTVEWLGPQILSEMISVALQDALNPSKEMVSAAENIGEKIISQIFGAQAMDTLKNLQQDQDVQKVVRALIAGKGLGGIWANGLGSILPQSLQEKLQSLGVGSLLAPKALSNFWEKGYFNFLANGDVLVSNSSFSNATGGALNFVAGKQIVFMGQNSIDFTNSQGTLNFFSNDTSNINLTTLNASDGLNINAQFNNLFVQKGTIATTNPYESLVVNAQNFYMGGTIDASKGGSIDLSRVTQNTQVGTIQLGTNASLKANNLGIITTLSNASSSALSVAQNFNLYNGATLSTGVGGINVGGNLNSYGTMTFNSNAQSVNNPFISVAGVATLNPNSANAFILNTTAPTPQATPTPQTQTSTLAQVATSNASTQRVYTLIDANKWIRYGLVNQAFNPNSWQDYLTLYTYLDIDGQKLQLNAQGNGLTYNGQAVQIGKDGLLVSYKNQDGQIVSASIAYNKMQVGVNQALNISVPNVQNYIQQIQGQSSVDAIYQAGGARVMNWLQQLLINTKNSPLFAPYYLEDHSIKELVQVAKDIANSIDLIASPNLKANSTDILQINTYTQQMSRLTKLSSPLPDTPSFADMLESLRGKKFASAVPNAMDVILKYSQRDVLKNNLWMQGVGGASFVAGGTGTLYGINVGYDRFVKGVIVGGYMAYGYSNFRGNIANSGSNNVNVGVYSRVFVKRSEITLSANETWGYNKTYIQASNPILTIVNQRYNYSTWTTNVGANYGYDFFFKNKHVVLKPQVALRYYYIGLSGLRGVMDNPLYGQFKANANPANKSVFTLNLALESRHYFGKNSYYFVLADIGRDLFVRSGGDKLVRFIGDDTLSYRKGGLYNTFAGLTTGGEVRLWRSFYINAGIGARFGINYQDINITGNVGMRYAF